MERGLPDDLVRISAGVEDEKVREHQELRGRTNPSVPPLAPHLLLTSAHTIRLLIRRPRGSVTVSKLDLS